MEGRYSVIPFGVQFLVVDKATGEILYSSSEKRVAKLKAVELADKGQLDDEEETESNDE